MDAHLPIASRSRGSAAAAPRLETSTTSGGSANSANHSATATPSMSDSRTSSSTRLGRRRPASATASAPVAASPTTSNPYASSNARGDARNSAWSSTARTVRLTSRSCHAPTGRHRGHPQDAGHPNGSAMSVPRQLVSGGAAVGSSSHPRQMSRGLVETEHVVAVAGDLDETSADDTVSPLAALPAATLPQGLSRCVLMRGGRGMTTM
jgi:hypothetical protein